MEDNIEINEDDLIDRYVKDLTPIELDFYIMKTMN